MRNTQWMGLVDNRRASWTHFEDGGVQEPGVDDPLRTTVRVCSSAAPFDCERLESETESATVELVLAGDEAPTFRRGDANGDGGVNIADPVFTLRFVFAGGPAPPCEDAADADDSGSFDTTDALRTLNYFFAGQAPPAPPGPLGCGSDPSADALDCQESRGCP